MSSEILLYIVLGISSISLIWSISIHLKIKKFFSRGEKNLEELISITLDKIEELEKQNKVSKKDIEKISNQLSQSIRGLYIMRYNPFRDQGGNQSFSICLIDEIGNGVVFSSLYSREKNSFFAKPVINGKTEYELTEEEKTVLNKAKEKIIK